MSRVFTCVLVLLVFGARPNPARAALDQAIIALEPGIALLRENPATSLGWMGAVSAAINVSDRLFLQVHADHKRFPIRDVGLEASVFAAEVVYALDIGSVTPFIEGGAAAVTLLADNGGSYASIVPVLGLGFNAELDDPLIWGVVVRYHPLFETALLSDPAYVTINARLGVWIGGP